MKLAEAKREAELERKLADESHRQAHVEITTLKQSMQLKEAAHDALNEKYNTESAKAASLSGKTSQLSDRVSQLEAELKASLERFDGMRHESRFVDELQEQMKQLQRDLEFVKKQLAERAAELHNALERERQANDRVGWMSSRSSSEDSQLAALQKELELVKEALNEAKQQVARLEKASHGMSKLQFESDAMRKHVAELNNAVADKTRELSTAKQQEQAAQRKYEEAMAKLETSNTSLALFEQRDGTLGGTLDEYKARIQELERESKTLQISERVKEEKLSETTVRLGEAQTRIRNLERVVAEMNSELNHMKVRQPHNANSSTYKCHANAQWNSGHAMPTQSHEGVTAMHTPTI